ncbi:cytochrome c oxidase subunit NDUFA4 [Panulirus ornatus]|uniref:cytochrome c oxidase subunit NDUFA4 n=1 Tax=Panulirus ornatus TaxID=150431 RepID=UPI003A8BB071
MQGMQGISLSSLKKHPALIPLYVCLGAGAVMAFGYTLRLAVKNPDVTWNRVTNPEPQQEYAEKQYKFYSPVRDYSTYRAPVPKYQD